VYLFEYISNPPRILDNYTTGTHHLSDKVGWSVPVKLYGLLSLHRGFLQSLGKSLQLVWKDGKGTAMLLLAFDPALRDLHVFALFAVLSLFDVKKIHLAASFKGLEKIASVIYLIIIVLL
jgi:hypothetical protein